MKEELSRKLISLLKEGSFQEALALLEEETLSLADLESEILEKATLVLESEQSSDAMAIKEILGIKEDQNAAGPGSKGPKDSTDTDINKGLALLDDLNSFLIETEYEKKRRESEGQVQKKAVVKDTEKPAIARKEKITTV
ncbi:hypothetical protein ACFL35_12390, partial [Candidatus Riflebacteria bacterium]